MTIYATPNPYEPETNLSYSPIAIISICVAFGVYIIGITFCLCYCVRHDAIKIEEQRAMQNCPYCTRSSAISPQELNPDQFNAAASVHALQNCPL